jgi:hypothetical protein
MTKEEKANEKQLRENPISEFTCCGKTMQFKEFQDHLTDDHKLSKEKRKGTRQMVMHMDGSYWFSYTYQWELESGLKFTHYTRQVRKQDDPMRF